ncbi:MAG: DNA cytosine methyltransferase [Acidobacteriaceae bacterium]
MQSSFIFQESEPMPRSAPRYPSCGRVQTRVRNLGRTDAPSTKKEHTVVSMFSGCGGLDFGFLGGFEVFQRRYKRLPFKIVWANEHNEAACRTYRRNVGEIHNEDVWFAFESMPLEADVVVGGFPCQDISVNGKRAGVVDGKRSSLYKAMIEGIKRTRPKVFVAENVKGLLMKYNEKSLHHVMRDFQNLGYKVSLNLYSAANYGIPQTRERVFIVGTSADTKPFVPPPAERLAKDSWMTAKDAIADLENLPENPEINHVWSRANRSPEQGNRTLRADRPAYTIRAECHGNIQYHYRLERRISMREAARFQSFPDNFIFEAKLRDTERQVGNAVPPVLAWHIARAVLDCLA